MVTEEVVRVTRKARNLLGWEPGWA